MHSARTFRLFVSSTFSDFIAEREALQQAVFPELERYCAMKGAHFQAVDLRWGITEEAQREHDTMRICLEEVRRCQQLSPRPNFAVLLGDRYGWEPVPARIPQEHLSRLIKAASQVDRKLIKSSYRLDENAIPPMYCLQERALDLTEALRHEARLLQALRRAARSFRGGARLPYFASATHQEIVLGALSRSDETGRALNPEQHVHVYVRHIEGMPHDESAKDFIDWDTSTSQVVPGARQRLHGLEAQLRRQLGDHVHDLHTTWSRHGRLGAVNKAYLKRFCNEFLNHQKALIDAELAILERTDERQLREQAHQHFGAERARVFAGRKALLGRIARYTTTTLIGQGALLKNKGFPAEPLILIGGGGSGKSALLARAAQESVHQAKLSGVTVLQRYIGGVPGTESLMRMLAALTADIASAYGQPEPPIPDNTKALAEKFWAALDLASSQQPLILYLDALDQLNSADSAWMLEWLPKELPEHVRLVASVRTCTSVEQSARRRYPRSLIEVPAMNPAEGQAMLEAWLADKRSAWFNAGIVPSKGRRLTPQQQESLLNVFNQTGSALWLKLAYEEASSWKSWAAPRCLPADIQGLIGDLIDQRLISQENHPKVFTERALAYLTAGRLGLSENELGRALATDTAVQAEFETNEKTQRKWENKKQLPPILWSRLFFDLQPYLGMVEVDGALLMRWFHREFAEAMKGRYLKLAENRTTIHSALADTFNELERELRPYETNDDELFRATDASRKQVSAALRRVMEQPWQLAQAERLHDLQTLLTDFGFCIGKCAAQRFDQLEKDYELLNRHISLSAEFTACRNILISNRTAFFHPDFSVDQKKVLFQISIESGISNNLGRGAQIFSLKKIIDWPWLARLSREGINTPMPSIVFEYIDAGVLISSVIRIPGSKKILILGHYNCVIEFDEDFKEILNENYIKSNPFESLDIFWKNLPKDLQQEIPLNLLKDSVNPPNSIKYTDLNIEVQCNYGNGEFGNRILNFKEIQSSDKERLKWLIFAHKDSIAGASKIDHQRVVTWSWDGFIKIWNIKELIEQFPKGFTYSLHTESPNRHIFLADQELLLSWTYKPSLDDLGYDEDKKVTLWSTANDSLRAQMELEFCYPTSLSLKNQNGVMEFIFRRRGARHEEQSLCLEVDEIHAPPQENSQGIDLFIESFPYTHYAPLTFVVSQNLFFGFQWMAAPEISWESENITSLAKFVDEKFPEYYPIGKFKPLLVTNSGRIVVADSQGEIRILECH